MSTQNDLLNVGIKKGTFYLSKNHPDGEGWEKQEFKNPKTGEDMVKYHKDISVEGKLVYLAMKEDRFKGMCLNMIVSGDTESYSLQIPIMNTGGSVKATNEYFNSIVGVLEKLSKGDHIKMFINNKNKDRNDRLYRNIVVLDEDGKLIKSNFSFKDIPDWSSVTTKDEFGREVKAWDASAANKFLIDKIKAVTDKWEAERLANKEEKAKEEGQPAAKKEPTKEEPSNKVKPATPNEAFGSLPDTKDDLPF